MTLNEATKALIAANPGNEDAAGVFNETAIASVLEAARAEGYVAVFIRLGGWFHMLDSNKPVHIVDVDGCSHTVEFVETEHGVICSVNTQPKRLADAITETARMCRQQKREIDREKAECR